MRCLTILTKKEMSNLSNDKKLTGVNKDAVPEILYEEVKSFMRKNTGHRTNPCFCLESIDGQACNLDNTEYAYMLLPIKQNDYYAEVSVKDDTVISLKCEDLFRCRNLLVSKKKRPNTVKREFKKLLHVGKLEGDMIYCFVPYISTDNCISEEDNLVSNIDMKCKTIETESTFKKSKSF